MGSIKWLSKAPWYPRTCHWVILSVVDMLTTLVADSSSAGENMEKTFRRHKSNEVMGQQNNRISYKLDTQQYNTLPSTDTCRLISLFACHAEMESGFKRLRNKHRVKENVVNLKVNLVHRPNCMRALITSNINNQNRTTFLQCLLHFPVPVSVCSLFPANREQKRCSYSNFLTLKISFAKVWCFAASVQHTGGRGSGVFVVLGVQKQSNWTCKSVFLPNKLEISDAFMSHIITDISY